MTMAVLTSMLATHWLANPGVSALSEIRVIIIGLVIAVLISNLDQTVVAGALSNIIMSPQARTWLPY